MPKDQRILLGKVKGKLSPEGTLFKKHQWKDLENILGESTGKGSRLKEMLSKMFAFTPVVPALGLKEDK